MQDFAEKRVPNEVTVETGGITTEYDLVPNNRVKIQMSYSGNTVYNSTLSVAALSAFMWKGTSATRPLYVQVTRIRTRMVHASRLQGTDPDLPMPCRESSEAAVGCSV